MEKNILMPGDSAGNYVVFLILFKDQFANYKEFWSAMILFPPVMTFSEAFAPHSMDTPVMMLIGFSLLYGICAIF